MKNMKRSVNRLIWIGPILILGLAAFSPIAVAAQTPAPPAADVQVTNDPNLGPILVASNGRTLYVFMADKPGVSNCKGACLAAWPAFTVPMRAPTGSPEVTGKLGTITRPEGTDQVTINDQPLYFFIQDMKPGDVKGNGINAFGGLWYVVKPDGTPNTGG